jgi:hypothetical protein
LPTVFIVPAPLLERAPFGLCDFDAWGFGFAVRLAAFGFGLFALADFDFAAGLVLV